jgi:GTP-binding protein
VVGFVDEVEIEITSGHGGSGAVSFRREKYVPKGGPDGGDGGKGGDVIFVVKRNLKTLSSFKQKRIFKAKNGLPGSSRKKTGKNGESIVIPVPPGTVIKDADTGSVLNDFKQENERWLFLSGGLGGKGNYRFVTPSNQAPRFAQSGLPGISKKIIVELRLIADIGLVGLPNAGKSTLLSVLTKAHPEIGSYPFTTKIPHLGVMRVFDTDIIIADIPGIIKGASHGAGLGIKFLRHISRTALIVFLVDLSDIDYINAINILKEELNNFSKELLLKKHLVIGTKLDITGTDENLKKLVQKYPEERIIGFSSVTKRGIKELKETLFNLVLKKQY